LALAEVLDGAGAGALRARRGSVRRGRRACMVLMELEDWSFGGGFIWWVFKS
jgi:hypothetical protein